MDVLSAPVIKPCEHVLNILATTREHHPNFALLLGAGASVSSGIKEASQLISEWRTKHHSMYGRGQALDDYLRQQVWFEKPDEYSVLFEALYDQPSQRREFIESCIEGRTPSWGHIYLVNLLRQRVFNTVFTTNFDDLVNEACYLYSSEVRPLVCAHDSSIGTVRLTSKRPKIIKLHGDFLFDNLKNTVRELESLELNMKAKLRQYAPEVGLLIVGYSGRDRSVMDALDQLLRVDDNFPHGIYWAVRKGGDVPQPVKLLSRFRRVSLFEIAGFDEFFANVHEALGLSLQREVSDPYGSLASRLNGLIREVAIPADGHPVIERDIQAIGRRIRERVGADVHSKSEVASQPSVQAEFASEFGSYALPLEFLAEIEARQGRTHRALDYLLIALEAAPTLDLFVRAYHLAVEGNRGDVLDGLRRRLEACNHVLKSNPPVAFTIALDLIGARRFDDAEWVLEAAKVAAQESGGMASWFEPYYHINKLQIRRHRGIPLTSAECELLRGFEGHPMILVKMGAAIVLGDYSRAEDLLLEAAATQELPPDALGWPIFDLLKPHARNTLVQKLLTEVGKRGKAQHVLREAAVTVGRVGESVGDHGKTVPGTEQGG